MEEYVPYHIALLLAIKNKEFDEAEKILARDTNNRYVHPVGNLRATALQMVASQGNRDLLNEFYTKNADINSADIGRCALYYAAYNGDIEVTKWLLQRNVRVDVQVDSRDTDIPYSSRKTHISPLHQAVENNHVEVVRLLVEAGANVNIEDKRSITPLLLAGSIVNANDLNEMNKFVEIVRILVAANARVDIIHPDTENTPLHHAVMLNSVEATKILLAKGARPTYQSKHMKQTPLHIVASTGNLEILLVLLEAILSLPGSKHYCLVDISDKNNCTALHRASYQGHRECVKALINHGANLAAMTVNGTTAVNAIFAHISQPLTFLTDILDSCVQINNKYPSEDITVDFSILAPNHGKTQMAVIMAIISITSNIRQLAILQHPLVETFLRLKWMRLRIIFFVLIFVHVFFITSLSVYATMLAHKNVDHAVTRRILMICSCILLFNNMIQVVLEPKHYLRQLETWLSFICAILSLTASIAGEFVNCSKEENENRHCLHWVLHFISITILLSWMQMMLLIGRVPMWGYYALMFSTVLKNILKVFLAFGYLIIGFALSFAVLFHGNEQFYDKIVFWKAIVKTMAMMIGEYDYQNLFDPENGLFLPITSRIVFFVFTILMSIVLMNLMIGLAVNDIQALEKEGHTRQLLKQAEFVAYLERVTSHRIFRSNWLHPCLRNSRCDIPTKITLLPRESYSSRHTSKIPANLMEAFSLLVYKTSLKNDNLTDKNVEMNDIKLISILSSLEKQIQELKVHYYRINNRKSLKRRTLKKKSYLRNL